MITEVLKSEGGGQSERCDWSERMVREMLCFLALKMEERDHEPRNGRGL